MTEREQQYFEVMLEQILHEVKTVAEGQCALDEKVERFHKEVKQDHQLALDLIKHSHEVLKEEIQGARNELKEEIQGVRNELKGEIQAVDRRLTSEIRVVGDKACLCLSACNAQAGVDARRQVVDGHAARIASLERKVA